ncbi:hypothetical protein BGZ96_008488 [Linnemannia gamsii]|uniref:Metallo-dependent phosphatase n=1 Tax=Linnemannia gamsii TaxID=64522 RepID=A0ABQ7JY50_9FUNG|nr:hypothetical protein BGZ96_008488 [Linnemannia gamsii]
MPDGSEEAVNNQYRMAIIADPQLTDWWSYHQSGLLLALVEMYTDIYMKRSFRRLHASLRPDAVLFLGDLNDGGRNTDEQTFVKNTGRFFEWVFATKSSAWNQDPIVSDALPDETEEFASPEQQQNSNSNSNCNSYENNSNSNSQVKKRQELTPEEKASNVDISGHYVQRVEVPLEATERRRIRDSGRSLRLYVAGNHDVGFGDTLIRSSMVRYKRVFGSVNYEVTVGNHSLVVLDTLALSSGVPSIRDESQQFLDHIKQEQPSLPRILFTHVPLFRLDTTSCGKPRETEQVIKDRRGEQYQNMVNSSLSREILESIQPDMVFSGDDHDWCEIAHPAVGGNMTPEVTLRTFSFAQGIQRPAFVMMTLFNPDLAPKNVYPVVPVGAGLPVSHGLTTGSMERPSGDTTFVYDECMLPWQMMIYMLYGALLVVSLNYIIIRQFRWMVVSRQHVKSLSILGRWNDSNISSYSRSDTDPLNTNSKKRSDDSVGTSSSRADQQLDGTTRTDDRQRDLERDQELYYDDEPVEPLSLGTSTSSISTKEKKMMRRWPLCAGLFWRRVVRDFWDVVKYVVPSHDALENSSSLCRSPGHCWHFGPSLFDLWPELRGFPIVGHRAASLPPRPASGSSNGILHLHSGSDHTTVQSLNGPMQAIIDKQMKFTFKVEKCAKEVRVDLKGVELAVHVDSKALGVGMEFATSVGYEFAGSIEKATELGYKF